VEAGEGVIEGSGGHLGKESLRQPVIVGKLQQAISHLDAIPIGQGKASYPLPVDIGTVEAA
jgi:hypothetical protein